ncbi:sigma-E factor negative regulatory protein [Lysobacter ciconiae]|uniref:Sigma-E factor negative regulatory protein n=1 Tax=Novilysobacter ciconiae TaxID=2781022 RepID=A0A7S6UEP2_9GAMM|nr:sigma-E factor negative regulatory protein [Lysobacter ciconiae]QOW18937.1 sigma-E factor negative regulatory protein [Lysobacter ciconiae]
MSNTLISNTLMSNNHRDARAGELSALFDGQLGPDETRFALKRLGQDAAWREACGRWQLAGDVLRGDGVAPAPTGFADRVMAAVAQEQQHAPLSPFPPRRVAVRHKPRWVGGALAASVAIAALFVARPMLDGEDPSAGAPSGREIVSTTSGAPSDGPAAALTAGTGIASQDAAPDDGSAIRNGAAAATLAAAAVASSTRDTPRRGERRQRLAARPVAGSRTEPVLDNPTTALANADATTSGPAAATGDARARPFMADAIATKPWPRAAVAGYPASAGMTVGFHPGDAGVAPISFYPFEPSTLRHEPLRGERELAPPGTHALPEPAGTVIRH